jgi:hypothetical protein
MDKWYPQPKQEKFLTLSCYEALFGGAKGPGKTDALLAESTRQIDIPGYKAIIFRRTIPKLAELIDRSHKWFSKSRAAWNGEKHRWTWPNKSFIAFGSCKDEKDKYNYQGHEYHFEGFDQLEEFTLTQYLFLLAQNRSADNKIKCYVRSTANPGNVGHAWVKDRFIDRLDGMGNVKYFKRMNDEDIETTPDDPNALSRAFVFSTVDDNKILLANDLNYLRILEMLPESDRKALRHGDWDAFSGQFFKEWSKNIHVIPCFEPTDPVHRFMGLDYGYTKPSSVGWYAALPNGVIVRYREVYGEGRTYEDLAEEVLGITEEHRESIDYCAADPAIWGDKSHHQSSKKKYGEEVKGESGADTIQKVWGSKIALIRADNSRVIGWGRMREYLKPFTDESNRLTAKFLVTASCKNFIRTISGLIHDEINPEDLDTAGEDHPQDEARYALMSRPRIPVLPPPPATPAEDFWKRVKKDTTRFNQMNSTSETVHELSEEGARAI